MNRNFYTLALSVVGSIMAVALITYASSTISTNISTGGTLSVTGASTLTGAVTTYGNSTFGDASTDVNLFTGTLQASTTALFTSGLTAYSPIVTTDTNFIGSGTTTPSTELAALGSATTTLYMHSSTSGRGSCIELKGTNNTIYRMYVNAGDTASTTLRGAGGIIAIWEAGACK